MAQSSPRSEEHTSNSSHSEISPLSLHDALPICAVFAPCAPFGSSLSSRSLRRVGWRYRRRRWRNPRLDRKSTRRTPATARSPLFPYTTLFRSVQYLPLVRPSGPACRVDRCVVLDGVIAAVDGAILA